MRVTSIALITALAACTADTPPESPPAEVTVPQVPQLEKVWTATGFSSPEGVAVLGESLLISNVAGEGDVKDGAGWISRLAMDGTVLDEKWIQGLNAPKGMAVRGAVLFVTDIDAYHTIDTTNVALLNTFDVPEAGFLNDATTWNGGVYATDSASGTIFQLDENGYKAWQSDTGLAGPNGLLPQGDDLLVVTMDGGGQLVSVANDGTQTMMATGMTDADGLARLDDGSYLVSSWPGRIWHVATDGTATSLIDTQAEGIFQNDLTRVGGLIIVPNWQPGTVTAWRVVYD